MRREPGEASLNCSSTLKSAPLLSAGWKDFPPKTLALFQQSREHVCITFVAGRLDILAIAPLARRSRARDGEDQNRPIYGVTPARCSTILHKRPDLKEAGRDYSAISYALQVAWRYRGGRAELTG